MTNSGYYVLLEENHGLSRIATLRNRRHHTGYQTFGGVIFTPKDNRSVNKYIDLKEVKIGRYLG
ncbi:MAG: phosphate/phosphite/phosphonate ABC transporter substrate-binding protein [Desulfobacula sp.]|nr:phosphate/phosphite/phosphonate ABC transporter substrate-binding protein [Desulfobacula sp.]